MKIFIILICFCLMQNPLYAAGEKRVKKSKVSLEDLVMPSEVRNLGKASGSIYYSKSRKNRALIPADFWGEVGKSGLHFIPQGTSLIRGLSLAGGPTGRAKLDEVRVTRSENGKLKDYRFNLKEGGSDEAHKFVLQSKDVVFVQQSTFEQDRAYYTSLIGVIVTVLSGILIYRQVERDNQ